MFLSCWNEQKYPHTRVEVVFITPAEKRTVMCLCGVTGRSGQYTLNCSVYGVTGRWQRPVSTDRTRPVTIFPLWNLTGNDRTLALSVRSLDLLASGHTERFHLGQMN